MGTPPPQPSSVAPARQWPSRQRLYPSVFAITHPIVHERHMDRRSARRDNGPRAVRAAARRQRHREECVHERPPLACRQASQRAATVRAGCVEARRDRQTSPIAFLRLLRAHARTRAASQVCGGQRRERVCSAGDSTCWPSAWISTPGRWTSISTPTSRARATAISARPAECDRLISWSPAVRHASLGLPCVPRSNRSLRGSSSR